jgi:hypothetical protein
MDRRRERILPGPDLPDEQHGHVRGCGLSRNSERAPHRPALGLEERGQPNEARSHAVLGRFAAGVGSSDAISREA